MLDVEQEIKLRDPKPAYVKIYDYYKTGEVSNVIIFIAKTCISNIVLCLIIERRILIKEAHEINFIYYFV